MKVVPPLITFTFLLASINCTVDPGPRLIATKGEIWPYPQYQNKSSKYYVIKPNTFDITITSTSSCSLLQNAVRRYQNIIKVQYADIAKYIQVNSYRQRDLKDDEYLGYLENLHVVLLGTCEENENPKLGMDEKYELDINSDPAILSADTIWGILRGLESFSQTIYIANDLLSLRINKTTVIDFPRFQYRGLMVDTARHFIPIKYLLTNLDAMAYNKLNVFHWHIVDDESFPYVSKKFPTLSEKGAYVPWKIYTVADIKTVIEYARERGIRVIPEFDTPGHISSWGVAYPELLTECYDSSGIKTSKFGPIDPTKNYTYEFLNDLLAEVNELFIDEYIHIGGDEVELGCWESNKNIQDFMKTESISTSKELQSYYFQKVLNSAKKLNFKSVVWEETFRFGANLPQDTIVQVWLTPWTNILEQVTASGKGAILSACWYLDQLLSGGDWDKYYICDPLIDFYGSDDQKKLILGGEACMWAEVVNQHNFISRVWPRTSAVAERLWSNEQMRYSEEVERRMEEHACRMNRRDINAQPPNSAGYCL